MLSRGKYYLKASGRQRKRLRHFLLLEEAVLLRPVELTFREYKGLWISSFFVTIWGHNGAVEEFWKRLDKLDMLVEGTTDLEIPF